MGNRAQLNSTVDQLQHQIQLMQAIFDSISDGVIFADENGSLTFNPSAERIIGSTLDVLPDRWTKEYSIFYADQATPVPTEELPLVRAMRGEATDEMEMFIRTAAKPEGVHISASGRPIRMPGAVRGGVTVFRDVTEKVRADEALAQAFAQGRLEVMDTILHNIGNAITSVAIGIGTLKEELEKNPLIVRLSALSETVEGHAEDWGEYVQHDPQGRQVRPFLLALAGDFVEQNQELIRTVERVNSQTSHIVDIVRAQRGFDSKAMTSKDVNLPQAISGAMRIVRDSFAGKGIQTHVDCAGAPEEIRVQESQFNQMLVNLLKNAMEAIEELNRSGGLRGKPRIEIRAYARQDFLVLRGRGQRYRHRPEKPQSDLRGRLYDQAGRERAGPSFGSQLRHWLRGKNSTIEQRPRNGHHHARRAAARFRPSLRKHHTENSRLITPERSISTEIQTIHFLPASMVLRL